MEFNNNPALTLADISQYAANEGAPPWNITQITGPFTGEDAESILVRASGSREARGGEQRLGVLQLGFARCAGHNGALAVLTTTPYSDPQDEELIGGIAQGCTNYFYTATNGKWMLEATNDVIASHSQNKIWSVSWGS